MVTTVLITVGLSVHAHGLTALPLTDAYALWFAAHPRAARDGERPGPTSIGGAGP